MPGFTNSLLPAGPPGADFDATANKFSEAPKVNGTPQVISDTMDQALGKAALYGLPGAGLGLIDTMGQSVGLWGDDTVKSALGKVTPGGFGDYYARNRTPLRIAGEIAGIWIPGKIASDVLKGARFATESGNLGAFFKNSTAVRALLGSSAELADGEAAIKTAAIGAANSGGIWAGRTFASPAVDMAKRGYYLGRVAETARQTVAFELGYRTLFNDSELLQPAEHSYVDEAAWLGAGFVGAGALDLAVGRLAVRKIIQGIERTASPEIEKFARDASNITFRPGDRGLGLTQFSSMASDLKGISKNSTDPALVSSLAQDQTNIRGTQVAQIKEMGTDTHVILPKTELSDPQVNLTIGALGKNESSLLYATKLANAPDGGVATFYTGLEDTKKQAETTYKSATTKILADKKLSPDEATSKIFEANAVMQKTIDAANEQHYMIENTGEISVYRNRADNYLDNKGFGAIQRTTYKEAIPLETGDAKEVTRSKLNPMPTVTLHDDFVLEGPKVMSPAEWSGAYAAGSKLITDYRGIDGQVLALTPKVNRFTIEGTLELAKAKPEIAGKIQLGGGFASLADAEFHVIDQKYKDFSTLMARTELAPKNSVAKAIFEKTKISPEQVIAQLNLPTQTGGGLAPLVEVFTQARLQGAKSLKELLLNPNQSIGDTTSLMDLLQGAMRDAAGVKDQKIKFETSGMLFRQKDIRPILISSKNVMPLARNEAVISGLVDARRSLVLERLSAIDPNAAPVVASMIRDLRQASAVAPAKNVASLREGVVSGRGVLTSQDRVSEQVEALKALSLVTQHTDKNLINVIGAMAKERLEPWTSKLFSGKARQDVVDFNRIEQSYRFGWDIKGIEDGPIPGTKRLVLDQESARNKLLAETHFGEAALDESGKLSITHMPDMSVSALRNKNAAPLVISALAADTAKAISDMSIQSGVEVNALRVALGSHAIKLRDFHLPSPELSRLNAYFIRNPQGNVIETYSRGTITQNKTRAYAAAAKLDELYGKGHVAIPLEDVRREHSIFDDNFFDVIDYSDQLAKTGAGISGGLAHAEIDTGEETLKSMITSLNEQYMNAGIRARAAVFEPQLNYAKQAGEIAGKSALKESNIWERYQAMIFSRSPQSPKGFLAAGYGAVESALDNALSAANSLYSEALASTEVGKAGARSLKQVLKRQTSEQEFMQYNSKAGEWSPFKTTEDWLASTHPEIPRWSARSALAKLSLVSSTMSLRLLDVGTALLNLSGVASTAPDIVASMRRLAGESREAWIARTGAWGSQATEAEIMTFSGIRALGNAYQAMWNGELTQPFEEAAKRGIFTPEYAALNKILNDPIHGESKMMRWVTAASRLADDSEMLSRKASWGMGYKIAKDLHKFDGETDRQIYALNFMNNMIGNYNPRNKPGMFQGAVGLPLGAFQTYMFNYYRRLYGYIENKDYRALATSYATQAAMYGASSVPGWNVFNSTMFSNYSGSDNLNTRLDRKLPPGVAELVLHGSLSSIPAIFGQGGIAFYPRGSVDLTQPIPSILDASRAPPIQFLSNIATGISKTLSNFFGAGKFSIQEQEEILANFSTNRAVKSIMEAVANSKTDRQGATVQNSTFDAIHIAAALLGSQPSSTRRLQDAFNAQQIVERHQDAVRSTLTEKTRALFRGGDFEVSDLQGLAQDYIKSGGNPGYFGQWIRNTAETAVTPKAVKKLQELGSSGKYLEFLNMLSALQQNAPKGGSNVQ